MTVWLVIETGWEHSTVVAVYETGKLAEAHVRASAARAARSHYRKPDLSVEEQPVLTAVDPARVAESFP